jgi:hypothetical protein
MKVSLLWFLLSVVFYGWFIYFLGKFLFWGIGDSFDSENEDETDDF